MPIRVLVVDDSAFMRRVISEAIAAQPDMEVAGQAVNGLDALLKVEQTNPDVVTLDVEMPEMDGLAALRHLMARYPRPVIMLSSLTQAGAVTTIRALTIGAVDFVAKPSGSISLDFHRVREDLIQKIRTAARARIHAPIARPAAIAAPPKPAAAPVGPAAPRRPQAHELLTSGQQDRRGVPQAHELLTSGQQDRRGVPQAHELLTSGQQHRRGVPPVALGAASFDTLVAIGTSTGGPRALSTVVPGLSDDGRTAYLIVQHMPAGFTRSLAERLDSTSSLHVREAEQGDRLVAGTVLVAPGDFHLQLSAHGTVQLFQGPRVHGVRPSVDVMLESVAQYYGARVVCAILTGMGVDGADGAVAIRAKGGFVIAEDEATCVVWGMPRAVAERGSANRIVRLENVSTAIAEAVASRFLHHTTLQLA